MAEYRIDFQYHPRPWQKVLHKSRKRFTIAVCHRRAGKSWAALHELLHCALSEPKKQFLYVAPFLSQAKKVMWGPLRERALMIPRAEVRDSEMCVIMPNGSRIWCLGADNADGLRGMYADGIVADEFQLWSPDTLPAVFLPMLAGRNGWLLKMGTPTGIDPLSVDYDKAKDDPLWCALKFPATETGVFTDEELKIQRDSMPENLYRLEYLCDFDAGSPGQLITGDAVETAMRRELLPEHYRDSPRIMACDIARQGDDSTVICRRQGFQCWEMESFQSADLMFTARKIREAYEMYQPDALFVDGGGVGAGAVDALREMGVPVIEVQFGSKASDPRYGNLRAEMYFSMANWINRGGRLPHDPGLKIELTSMTHKTSDKGATLMESKEDLKKRGMKSPDKADALAATFAMPVTPKSQVSSASQARHDWDPF